MTDDQVPAWATRLRQERKRRLWSQKTMAVRLRNAADESTRARLPDLESLRRYVRFYESGRHHPGDLYSELYCRAFGLSPGDLFGKSPGTRPNIDGLDRLLTQHDAANLTDWVLATNTSDDAIAHIAQATSALAEAHTQSPPAELLPEVIELHRQIQALLHGGRQRLRQTRDLFRLDSDLLAHACLLLGDLCRDRTAAAYGRAAVLCAEEADANRAVALSACAKTERWRLRYAESADLARQGFASSPPTPIRTLLACQEANAAGLLGDPRWARQALRRAEEAAHGPMVADSGASAWSCPRPRQALFTLSVATRSGDPEGALQAAEMADAGWASGDRWVASTWAQIRIGSGIAYAMKAALDAAAEQIAPMLTLAPELRLATVTRYLADMDLRLQHRRFQGSAAAAEMREQIREFNSAALPAEGAEAED